MATASRCCTSCRGRCGSGTSTRPRTTSSCFPRTGRSPWSIARTTPSSIRPRPLRSPAGLNVHARRPPAMTETPKLMLEKDGPIGWIIFNQPQKRNAVSLEMWQLMPDYVRDLATDDAIRVVILRGAGDQAFVAGADISQFKERRRNMADQEEYSRISARGQDALTTLSKPLLAMIHGYCVGGGVGIAITCDLRIAADVRRTSAITPCWTSSSPTASTARTIRRASRPSPRSAVPSSTGAERASGTPARPAWPALGTGVSSHVQEPWHTAAVIASNVAPRHRVRRHVLCSSPALENNYNQCPRS